MSIAGYLNFILALIFVLGLIGIAAWGWRRVVLGDRLPGLPGRAGRIRLIETRAIDARRRCVLIGCDDREYLVILGSQSETLIDSRPGGIRPSERKPLPPNEAAT